MKGQAGGLLFRCVSESFDSRFSRCALRLKYHDADKISNEIGVPRM